MSKTTKKKATTTKAKAKSTTSDVDMKNLLGLMQGMMGQQKPEPASHPAPRAQVKDHGINSISEVRDDMNMLSSSLNGRMTQVEVKVTAISESIDEIKEMVRIRNSKFDQDMQNCIKHTNEVVEEERSKRLKLLKALQKKLSDDDVVIMERVSKLKEEVTKITAGLSSDINGTFTELTKVKANVDSSSQQRSQWQHDNSSTVEKLASKMKILEVRLAASNNGMFVDDMGSNNGDFPDDASDEFINNMDSHNQFMRTRYRSQSGSINAGGFPRAKVPVDRILQEMKQQLSKCEGNIETTNTIANDAFTACTGKSHRSGTLATGHNSRRKLGGGSKSARRVDSDSDSDDENTKISLRSQQAELKALVKRVKTLGENTSKACRTLSTGLTDVQQSTLFLYAWCDKAHDAFSVVSSQLGLTTNICPRVQVYRSTATAHKAINDL